MAPTVSLPREDLASFLQDLPDGAHGAVSLERIPLTEALEACREAAEDAGELLAFSGGTEADAARGAEVLPVLSEQEAVRQRLQELASRNGRAVLLAVDAERSVRARSAEAHLAAEEALGRTVDLGRVVCFYTREAAEAVGRREVRGLHGGMAFGPGGGSSP